jgi:hypothetical protein
MRSGDPNGFEIKLNPAAASSGPSREPLAAASQLLGARRLALLCFLGLRRSAPAQGLVRLSGLLELGLHGAASCHPIYAHTSLPFVAFGMVWMASFARVGPVPRASVQVLRGLGVQSVVLQGAQVDTRMFRCFEPIINSRVVNLASAKE